jgi:hypothetical protein
VPISIKNGMEVIEKILTYHHNSREVFHFYPLGDVHLGSVDAQEDDFSKKVNECANRENSYALGMGDYADCITKNDPRFDMEGLADWVKKGNIVESQRQRVVELFKPLAETGKLIGLGTGNHEEEIHLRHQDDITRNICQDLNVPYAGYSCFVILSFRRKGSTHTNQYVWHSWHGAGSAQTEGARLMRLMRLVNDIQAHVYTMGHLHAMTSHTPDRLMCVHGRVKSIKLAATITGSWLKAYSQPRNDQLLNASYAEKKGYKPSRIECPVINICPETDELTIES